MLTAYVEALNKLDDKFGCMDTMRREEAHEAYLQLVELAAVDEKEADEWWSQLCDF